MAKVLKDEEMLAIIQGVILGDEIDCADAYKHFLEGLGDLIADNFGGDRGGVDYIDDSLGYTCSFNANDCVPVDGGVYAKYDTDVTWTDGKEVQS